MIHVVTAFSRFENRKFYKENLRGLGVVWHPLLLDTQEWFNVSKEETWIQPYRYAPPLYETDVCYYKLNCFLINAPIVDTDTYFFLNDDDWFDTAIIDKIDAMPDPVIFVSMKRGDDSMGGHPASPLIAGPDVHVGTIGLEQYFLKGKVMKQVRFRSDIIAPEEYPPHRQGSADGHLAETLMKLFPVRYEPEMYIYFNYLEPGRWKETV